MRHLCDELDDTASLLDLLLSLSGNVAGTDDDRDSGETALSEDLGVAEGEEVEDGSLVRRLVGEVGVALVGGDQRPELVEVDDGLPELLLRLVEVTHTDFTEVTGMVLVDVGAVVVLTTGHTTTTGMLAVLAVPLLALVALRKFEPKSRRCELPDTSVTGGDVTLYIVLAIDIIVRRVRDIRGACGSW